LFYLRNVCGFVISKGLLLEEKIYFLNMVYIIANCINSCQLRWESRICYTSKLAANLLAGLLHSINLLSVFVTNPAQNVEQFRSASLFSYFLILFQNPLENEFNVIYLLFKDVVMIDLRSDTVSSQF